jgi:hypothetical protein
MSVPDEFKNRYVYHFTHVENLHDILEYGLLSTNEKKRLGIEHTAIAYEDIQERRSCMDVPCGRRGVVHDYVPLYFCKRSSMLLAVVNGKIADQQFIIYFDFPIDIMDRYPFVLTDASANTSRPPNFYDSEENLSKLKWDHIDSQKWAMTSEKAKQSRQAELLIYKCIPIADVSKIIVWNESIRDIVLDAYKKIKKTPPQIGFDNFRYYIDFFNSGKRSIVTGPYFIQKAYKEIITSLLPKIGTNKSAKYEHLFALIKNLREDFGCLPETSELIGLETENEVHSEDVGSHTLQVVYELLRSEEYQYLGKTDKLLVEVAAYLHDIGKGPKSRWIKNGGRQKVDPDHPIKTLPMLERILTCEIETLKQRSAKVICKLVCYHDLIGDILSKGRRIDELFDIIDDIGELNMLIALAKADMQSIGWSYDGGIDGIRKQVSARLKSKSDN